jgi:pSer/pThr/pTyr-binding forkhead associated (FHA) protein
MVEEESIPLADLESTNGSFVNGHRVGEANLRPNDWVSIGKHILTLKTDSRCHRQMAGDADSQQARRGA